MAFILAAVGSKTQLDRLTLTPFKTRLMPVPSRELRYVKRQGFEVSAILEKPGDERADPLEVVKKIVAATPGINQTQIVERAQGLGISKHKTEEALKRQDVFRVERGERNGLRYWLVPSAPAEEGVAA
jgi:hypothetical protein